MSLIIDHNPDFNDFHVILNTEKMAELYLEEGDIIELSNSTTTRFLAAISGDDSCPSDKALLSRSLRVNGNLYIGSRVSIRKYTKCDPADCIVFAPIAETIENINGPFTNILSNKVLKNLKGIPIQKNFIVPVFTLNRVVEFQAVILSPSNSVVVTDPAVIACKNATISVKNTKSGAEDSSDDEDFWQKFDEACFDDIGGFKSMNMIRSYLESRETSMFFVSAPSGCGKSFLGDIISNETDLYFTMLKGMQILAVDTKVAIKQLKRISEETIQNAPSILFIDDFDFIAEELNFEDGEKDFSLAKTLYDELNRLKYASNVIVFCTMKSDTFSPMFRQHTLRIDIQLPNYKQRLAILKAMTRKMFFNENQEKSNNILEKIANMTEGKTSADLLQIVEENIINTLDMFPEGTNSLNFSDFQNLTVKLEKDENISTNIENDINKKSNEGEEEEDFDEENENKTRRRKRRRSTRRRRHRNRRNISDDYSDNDSGNEENEYNNNDSDDDNYVRKRKNSNKKIENQRGRRRNRSEEEEENSGNEKESKDIKAKDVKKEKLIKQTKINDYHKENEEDEDENENEIRNNKKSSNKKKEKDKENDKIDKAKKKHSSERKEIENDEKPDKKSSNKKNKKEDEVKKDEKTKPNLSKHRNEDKNASTDKKKKQNLSFAYSESDEEIEENKENTKSKSPKEKNSPFSKPDKKNQNNDYEEDDDDEILKETSQKKSSSSSKGSQSKANAPNQTKKTPFASHSNNTNTSESSDSDERVPPQKVKAKKILDEITTAKKEVKNSSQVLPTSSSNKKKKPIFQNNNSSSDSDEDRDSKDVKNANSLNQSQKKSALFKQKEQQPKEQQQKEQQQKEQQQKEQLQKEQQQKEQKEKEQKEKEQKQIPPKKKLLESSSSSSSEDLQLHRSRRPVSSALSSDTSISASSSNKASTSKANKKSKSNFVDPFGNDSSSSRAASNLPQRKASNNTNQNQQQQQNIQMNMKKSAENDISGIRKSAPSGSGVDPFAAIPKKEGAIYANVARKHSLKSRIDSSSEEEEEKVDKNKKPEKKPSSSKNEIEKKKKVSSSDKKNDNEKPLPNDNKANSKPDDKKKPQTQQFKPQGPFGVHVVPVSKAKKSLNIAFSDSDSNGVDDEDVSPPHSSESDDDQ